MVKEIKLQNGMIALVDDEDYEMVNQYEWAVKSDGNNSNLKVYNSSLTSLTLYLNRFILQLNDESKIFHKDGNALNFMKENLIVVNQSIVSRKRRGNRNSSSKYKGVSWHNKTGKWIAQIHVNGHVMRLGSFGNEDNAARTYNDAAIKYFGEYAYQNVIGEDNSANTFNVSKVPQRRKRNKLGFKGIYEKDGKYQARVWNGEKSIYAGISKVLEEAAKMHDKKAYELFGESAVLNFPELITEYRKAN